MGKAKDFKFDMHVPRGSPVMPPEKFIERGLPGSCDALNFWTINANSSRMAKAMDSKFGKYVLQGESRHEAFIKFLRKGRG